MRHNLPRRTLLATMGALGAAALGQTALPRPALAQSRIPIKFSLNLPFNGTNLPFLYGRDRGFFAEQGFDVTSMDSALGSDAISRVANNTYDVSFGDITSLADLYAQQPTSVPLAVFNIYKTSPAAVISWKKNNLVKPADLIGKTLGGPPTDNAYQLFPAFFFVNKLDPALVKFQNIDLRLREGLFMRREVDGVTGFDSTVWLNLKGLGVKLEDISIMYYSDYGLDLYSNSVLVSRKFLHDNEAAIPRLLLACSKCWQEAIAHPQDAVASLVKAEPLTNAPIEADRFDWVVKHQVLTPETTQLGLGGLDPARLQRGLKILSDSRKLPNAAPADAVWSGAYLPPVAQRFKG